MTASDLTYPEVGATAGDLPPGYDHIRRIAVLGSGDDVFRRACEALMTWEMHRRSGLTVEASGQPITVGADVRFGWSAGLIHISLTCRVVLVVDESKTCGFAYGSLSGHPERGEESFMIRHDSAGVVTLEVVAFSRPALWWSRVGAPVTRLVQRRIIARYLDALVER